MEKIAESFLKDYEYFEEKTKEFYEGILPKNEYKGISGGFGSYAEKNGETGMIRLRMPGGQLTKDKFRFVVDMANVYHIQKMKFTTCETIQLHNLKAWEICSIAAEALENGIICRGGGGDFPRNVMVSPLTGVDPDETFDVMPYAKAMSDYLLTFIGKITLPRKLKVCFSNSAENVVHATFRDLGFVANADQTFDVYIAGGLGLKPKLGVRVAEHICPEDILYYAKAMVDLFLENGNYKVRSQARTRFMQDTLGKEGLIEKYQEKLTQALAGEDLKIAPEKTEVKKEGAGEIVHSRVIPQKQKGLFAVSYHPIGGVPDMEVMKQLYATIKDMEEVEVRLSTDETAYIINLTADEAKKVLEVTKDGAETVFEHSVACIGARICQHGLRDSQDLLKKCVEAVRAAGIPDGALPAIHISGCPSSCSAHQTAEIGFQGAGKKVDGEMRSAFTVFLNGCSLQGKENITASSGMILKKHIPAFLVELGKMVENSGQTYEEWGKDHLEEVKELAEKYVNEV